MDRVTEREPQLMTDARQGFVDAVSMCAQLEGMCAGDDAARLLAHVGMARNELTDYGARLPASLHEVPTESVAIGLAVLEALLTTLIGDADDLCFALRLYEAREILREFSVSD